jgi:short-subunit dehydrogenase
MKRNLSGAVVVITGASSGIGREAALQLARKETRLVLAARDAAALEEVARACRAEGAQAICVPADVSVESHVTAVRDEALCRFGKIDVWVNDAAAYMMGGFEQCPTEAIRRLLDVNVMGVVHGSKAALSEFRRNGSGVLINVGSIAGKAAYAQASAYCATKHAVHAITEALRQELVGTEIHACLVVPATVDTPLFQHAANFTGRTIEAMRPIYPVERVAAAIVSCAERPRRQVAVGAAPRMMNVLRRTAPAVFERMEPKLVDKDHLGDEPAPDSAGNLYQPIAPHAVDGGWGAKKSRGMIALP